MDFGDSPEEAAFRLRLRAWLRDNNPGLPASSTDDEYWAGQAAWHQLALRRRILRHVLAARRSAARACPPSTRSSSTRSWPRPGPRRGRASATWCRGSSSTASDEIRRRFLPGIVNGRDRWCQGFSEPDAGSDLASLRTRADRDGDEYVLTGHKVWTSYSDDADWCLVLARTDHDVAQAPGASRPSPSPCTSPASSSGRCRMINGITKEFGEVLFDGARVPAANMIGEPGEGWPLAMTVVSHEREPGELGYVARYAKQVVNDLRRRVQARPPAGSAPSRSASLGWAIVEVGDAPPPRLAAGCPTGSTASPTVPRARSTSC